MKDDCTQSKVLVILGPTASGKSALAVKLAKKYNGEVISADSRQVYKGLDLGTGKITKKEMSGIMHHLLDVASPRRIYTVSDYKQDAEKAVLKIIKKGKLPIICGGTGFYIDALIYDMQLPDVQRNITLRKKLGTYSTEKLYTILAKKDPKRAKTVDKHNKVRLIRALEIVDSLGSVPSLSTTKKYDHTIIGLQVTPEVLQKKIHTRILSRIKAGMITEVKNLHAKGLSWKRMNELGLEYRYISHYLQGLISKEELVNTINTKTWQYAKRQMTWFKKNKEIQWFEPGDIKNLEKFLKTRL